MWLRDKAREDPDIRAMVNAMYLQLEVNSMSELLINYEEDLMDLYEAAADMCEGDLDMARYDDALREYQKKAKP